MQSLKNGESQFDKAGGFFLTAIAIILIVLSVASYNQGLTDCSQHQAVKVASEEEPVKIPRWPPRPSGVVA